MSSLFFYRTYSYGPTKFSIFSQVLLFPAALILGFKPLNRSQSETDLHSKSAKIIVQLTNLSW